MTFPLRKFLMTVAIGFALVGAGQTLAAAGSVKNATITLISKGITGISPTGCTFEGGTGSANAFVCQLTATTLPSGQTVTWTMTGGVDKAKFVLTPAGALSVGAFDIGAGNYAIIVTAITP